MGSDPATSFISQHLQLKNARGHTLLCSHYLPSPFPEDTPLPCVIYCHGNRLAGTILLQGNKVLLQFWLNVLWDIHFNIARSVSGRIFL
jgi:hypothetical protein